MDISILSLAAPPALAAAVWAVKKINAHDTHVAVLQKEVFDFKHTFARHHDETRADLRDVKESLNGVVSLLMRSPYREEPRVHRPHEGPPG